MFRTTPFRHSHLNHQSRSVRIHIARFTLFSRLGHHSARHVFTRLRSHFFFFIFSRLSWPASRSLHVLFKALMARVHSLQGSHGPLHIFSRLSWPVSQFFFSRLSWPVFFFRLTAPAHPHDPTPSHMGKPTRATQCILRILFKLLIIKPPTAAVSGCHRPPLPEVRRVASQRFRCGWVGFEIARGKCQARPNRGGRPLKPQNRDHKNPGPLGPFFFNKPKINFVYTKTVAPR